MWIGPFGSSIGIKESEVYSAPTIEPLADRAEHFVSAWHPFCRFGNWLHAAVSDAPATAPWVRLNPELKTAFMVELLSDESRTDTSKFKKVQECPCVYGMHILRAYVCACVVVAMVLGG